MLKSQEWPKQFCKIKIKLDLHYQKKKKSLNDPDNHSSVITHLEPDILEGEIKWVLGSITINKAGAGDRMTTEQFKIPKDDIAKVLYSIYQQIWKTQW